ncbi:hypothetical protein V1264_021231 [Littorina saxatilis]|uniref:Uncharacterized protein n=1 Tax=Littorina saxatilis TaxID=31220 RepID=A0AAN9AHX6_9CAEN
MEIDEPRCFGSGEKKKVAHKVDKVLLDLFWKLAEGNDNERVKAAESLVNRLAENKKQDAEGHASQEKYCLQRLVRGMASSRKFARVGYAVTLTKLLRETKDIKVKKVLEVIAEELKVSAHDPKTEVGNKLLGRVFAYGAVIQSERKLKGEQLGTVVRELLTVGSKKSHIRPTVTQTLMDLIGCLTLEVFSETVWPVLKEDLDKGWEECTPDRLIFLLACRNKDKSLVDKAYLKAHWGAAKILGKKNYEHILQLFRRSVETPQLQQMMLEMVAKEMTRKVDDMDDLKDFWTKVGNPLLASTVPRKQVALSLFCHLLEQTSDPALAESMLFPAAAAVICRAYDRKDDALFDVCRRAESLLVGACRDQEKSGAVLSMVTKFIQTCHRLKYHDFLRSNTLSTLVSSLQGESVKEFSEMCMDCMMGRGDLVQQDDDKEDSAKHRDQFSQQLVPLLRVAAVNPTVQQSVPLTILQFLLLHTFFKVIKATKDIPHCQEVGPNFSPALRNQCQSMFYKTLTQLLSMRPDRQNPDQQLLTYIRVLSDLAHFTQKLLSNANTVQPVKAFAPELQEEWQKIMKIISNSKPNQKRKSTSGQVGEAETFTLLILHLAFDLFKDPEATMEVLQDIYICHQKAAKKQKAKQAEDGEPEWMEVMTEILLSMLSRPSKLARKTAVAVFGMLSSHVTPAAVHLITQVLKENKSKKDDLFEFEDIKEEINGEADDDDDDKNSEEENDDDDDSDGKEEVMPADEDSSEDDSDDDDAEVDDELRRSVKAALGPAAAGSDEEVW